MRILYLYAEVMGYTIATIRALAERGAEVHVVYWDHKKLTPYQAPEVQNVYFYARSEMSVDAMNRLASEISPMITVMSGWMDKGYLSVAKRLRAKGIPVIACFDDQWHGTLRQRFASFLGAAGYFSRLFSHAWVSGIHQYEYAKRLGFNKKHIVFDLYSADTALFNKAYYSSVKLKKINYPHRFLFVGRLEPIKGLDVLIQAWEALGEERRDWELHLVGNGSLRTQLESKSSVVTKDFMQPELLMNEIANAGCFVLPSRREPWGVVVHEFAAAGLPLIISDVVGAATSFLIHGMNGFSFKATNPDSLARRMLQIISMNDGELLRMAINSNKLSQKITTETSAANLLSIASK